MTEPPPPIAKPTDDPLADVHAALLRVIAELRAAGITPPIALHQVIHALTWARRAQRAEQ